MLYKNPFLISSPVPADDILADTDSDWLLILLGVGDVTEGQLNTTVF